MSLEGQLRQYPETRTMQKVISSNPVWQTLEIELAKQQIELQKMLRTRTEEHPDVQATRQQIAETQRKLKEVGTTILNSTTEGVDPTRQNLLQNYVSARVESAAGDAACSAASQVVSSLESQMETLPEKEMRLAQLTMEEDRAKNTYSLLQQKLDEASIKEKEAENDEVYPFIHRTTQRSAVR
jgi:uncharacterized protein involved in exopolysaccharide biosynthesis